VKLRFIIDNIFPTDLADMFAAHGHEVVTARRLGLTGSSDITIWQHAEETNSIVVSHDSDFKPMAINSTRAKLLHYRGGNRTTADLIAFFNQHLPTIIEALKSGESYIELS
jgi:predicted nuclease of predicted toxin-antitoxin system